MSPGASSPPSRSGGPSSSGRSRRAGSGDVPAVVSPSPEVAVPSAAPSVSVRPDGPSRPGQPPREPGQPPRARTDASARPSEAVPRAGSRASARSSEAVPRARSGRGEVPTGAGAAAQGGGGSGVRVGREPSAPVAAPRRDPRPRVTELRLSAFARHRGASIPVGQVTLLAGPSGSGKSAVLAAYEALARLGGGAELGEVFPDPVALVPERARPDAQRRRGFRIGCTADGPEGPVRLDVAVQAEPELRIVGERLTSGGLVLLETA
ncbi:hypothetical protein ABZ372_29765, partial [Streptomyces sp. NPDC005921]